MYVSVKHTPICIDRRPHPHTLILITQTLNSSSHALSPHPLTPSHLILSHPLTSSSHALSPHTPNQVPEILSNLDEYVSDASEATRSSEAMCKQEVEPNWVNRLGRWLIAEIGS